MQSQSGDLAFAQEKWDNVWRAYQFLRSTYDAQGFAQNFGVGHGWVEGGPLLPVKNEYYQAGLGVEALHALSNLARLVGKDDVSKAARFRIRSQQTRCSIRPSGRPSRKSYAFALDKSNQRVDEPSCADNRSHVVWFGRCRSCRRHHHRNSPLKIIRPTGACASFPSTRKSTTARAITMARSGRSSRDGPRSAEYRYHRAFPAYSNLRSNALLATDGALGHFTEVLSGDYYQSFATSSPHQIWSAAMVISPILRGMFGLQTDAEKHQITLAPHVPADWTSFAIRNVHVARSVWTSNIARRRQHRARGSSAPASGDCWVDFSPAFSLRTRGHRRGDEWTSCLRSRCSRTPTISMLSVRFP